MFWWRSSIISRRHVVQPPRQITESLVHEYRIGGKVYSGTVLIDFFVGCSGNRKLNQVTNIDLFKQK